MFARNAILTLAVTATLLTAAALGAYPALAQTQPTPTTTPAAQTVTDGDAPAFEPMQMAGTMAAMVEQMGAMMAAAPDDAARRNMAPPMMATLNGMIALNRTMMGQMPAAERAETAPQMMSGMARMTEMMAMMQPMMAGGARMTGTMAMEAGRAMGPMDSGMQMGQMMNMMGMMMQMMGSEMMGPGMMGNTTPMTGTMPMEAGQAMGPMDSRMQAGQMMNMMGMMMQMMGHMHANMIGGDIMMGPGMMSEEMGQSGAATGRQAEIAERGAKVMPFDLEQTNHVFEKTENGGVQQVLVREGAAANQVSLIQEHLSQEAARFQAGNFSDPAQIHGGEMPGLTILRQRASDIVVRYTPLANGGQIDYASDAPEVVEAIHDWFDAQLSDHGAHAMGARPAAQHRQSAMGETSTDSEVSTQSVEGGGVTVKVTPLTLTDATAPTLDFAVALDTHSIELDYDLAKLAVLRDDLGNEYQPAAWSADQSGGHHVSGVLSFGERATILGIDVASLELDITGIADVPSRLFTWDWTNSGE